VVTLSFSISIANTVVPIFFDCNCFLERSVIKSNAVFKQVLNHFSTPCILRRLLNEEENTSTVINEAI
jgi:hypothetical protein